LQQPPGYSPPAHVLFTGTGTTSVAGDTTATSADLTTSALNGAVLTFKNSAGTAVTITIDTTPTAFNPTTKAAQVQSLDQLNQALADAGVNLSAVITGAGGLTFTSTNDGGGQTITTAGTAPATLDATTTPSRSSTAIASSLRSKSARTRAASRTSLGARASGCGAGGVRGTNGMPRAYARTRAAAFL